MYTLYCVFSIIAIILSRGQVLAQNCSQLNFGENSIVCVCNATYCDFYPNLKPASQDEFVQYASNKGGERLNLSIGKIKKKANSEVQIKVNSDKKFQKVEGFGGAFTDATGINIKKLSKGAQDNLLKSYFSENGSKYNLARIPIGGTDFSTKPYTYADIEGDIELQNFKIANEDFEYKIPFMKGALKLNPSLKFLSAAWTAPVWMKNNHVYYGESHLQEKYYQLYADYIVKFFEEYKKQGLEFWAVTPGNEPFTSKGWKTKITSMFWSPDNVAKWITNNLYPSIKKSSSNQTQILLLDDQREYLFNYVSDVKNNFEEALKYVTGVGIHWYKDFCTSPLMIDKTRNIIPDKFILMTEACVGDKPWEYPKVRLGSWERAELLIEKMFENLNHWVAGWVDWNMALDPAGGPTWIGNFVDSPIIVDGTKDVFYKQPLYYAMTHFSKFIPRSSVKIEAESLDENILSIAFKTPDNQTVVVLYNKYKTKQQVSIVDKEVGVINLELPEYSLHTVLYKN